MSFKVYMLGQFKQQANDGGQITAIRIGDWKAVFLEQQAKGMMVWNEPFVELRSPKLFNLRQDPFERANERSITYWNGARSSSGSLCRTGVDHAATPDVSGIPTAAETSLLQPG